MRDSYFLREQTPGISRNFSENLNNSSQNNKTRYGRVLRIVLEDGVGAYTKDGEKLPIGAIEYQDLSTTPSENIITGYAIPLASATKKMPVVNEIVQLTPAPNYDFQFSTSQTRTYYSEPIPIFSTPNHNALPSQDTNFDTPIGTDVPELVDINPLFPFPGDTLIEGRQGQSIRIGGYASTNNPFVGEVNNGQPYIIISNGQIKTPNGIDHIIEDINEDPNSLYFLSNHITSLNPANTKRSAYEVPPIEVNKYIGSQVVLNSGRVVINSKEDSILLLSKESIGLSGKTVNIDGEDLICLDANKIFLGQDALKLSAAAQPGVKGTDLTRWLEDLLTMLESIGNSMKAATSISGGPVTQLNLIGPEVTLTTNFLRTRLNSLKSKKVFIE